MSRSAKYPTYYKAGDLDGKDVYFHPQLGLSIERGGHLTEMTPKELAVWRRRRARDVRRLPR